MKTFVDFISWLLFLFVILFLLIGGYLVINLELDSIFLIGIVIGSIFWSVICIAIGIILRKVYNI